jgi:uracil-DNA glycosylase
MHQDLINCKLCLRLTKWCQTVAKEKRAAYTGETYWGRPVPSFGDSKARILIVGLAPGAHGANRTGRMFTGDRSGDWLFGALHSVDLASQPTSVSRNDGLKLNDTYITAVVHCAPPDNKPTIEERDRCLPYLVQELEELRNVRVIVALGSFAWDGTLLALNQLELTTKPKPKFGHGVETMIGPYHLIGSYHPSQQNTFTGKLTKPMLRSIFERAKTISSTAGSRRPSRSSLAPRA